ncbi:MAG TPA: SusD/RagB family nutrient-binding outer membrane lipoprotein [Puia sp.]|nr:SusD/RagB family nutrient-binding outer membrane lipoprotein [Puia sp.]
MRTRHILACVALAALLGSAACKKSFYTGVNNNPNVPTGESITPTVLLPPIENAIAYLQGGDMSRFISLNMQQVKGDLRQAQAYYSYVYTSQDFDNLWGNIYTDVMENDLVLMQISDAKGFNAYAGVARILRAYMLQLTVDCWGSIPYSKAGQGANDLKPAYDSDKDLYDSIISLVDTGIARLGNPNVGSLKPEDEDVLYGGDPDEWAKFGHAIKARVYGHQAKGDANMAVKALQQAAQAFASNDENARYVFGSTETSANPWYQFNQQRGDIGFVHGNAATMMMAQDDPRFSILLDTAEGADGLGYYGKINSPVEFITFDEMEFLTAEMVLRNGGSFVASQAFLNQAITMNMKKLGVKDADIATYITSHGQMPTTSVDNAIAFIATQEYLALYLNPEVWSLWRRTGAPALTPVAGQSIPRRFLYPQTEYSYNKANVPTPVTLINPKIFWDK